jgi:hypothetical protein
MADQENRIMVPKYAVTLSRENVQEKIVSSAIFVTNARLLTKEQLPVKALLRNPNDYQSRTAKKIYKPTRIMLYVLASTL